MDKETLSKYGWVVIVIIVLVILMSFAAPFGQYFYDSTMAMVESLKNSTNIERLFTPNEVVTNYTLEQIEADEHLYAIGQTQPEYVVAKFNADYTEVIITKNGDESNGLMMDWDFENATDISKLPFGIIYNSTLSSVIVREGVVSIGSDAFMGINVETGEINSLIKNVQLPESLCYIKDNAFSGCCCLQNVNISDNVISIGNHAFEKCTSLASVVIGNGVTSIGDYAFDGCTSLTSITIPDSVTSLGIWAFYGCTSLESITIPDSVTSIGGYTFDRCTSLTSVVIGNGVTSIGDYAFAWCTSLASITIPDSVTSIGELAFSNTAYYNDETNWENDVLYICNHLIKAKNTVSGDYVVKDGTKTIVGDAFWGCTSLTNITIPDSVTSIGKNAFYGCTSLVNLTIPNDVTSIGVGAFWNCTSLASITIPDSVTSIGKNAFFGTAYYNDETNWENDVLYICNHLIKAKNTIRGVYVVKDGTKTIADYAFEKCTSLANVTLGNSVTSIGNHAFEKCTSLASITIPNSVTNIGNEAFYNCTSLASITIPESVTSIGDWAFYGCTSLASITIPDSVTSIGSDAFYNIAYYNDAINWENDVLYIGNHLIKAKDTIRGAYVVKDGIKTIANDAFEDCYALTSITIPESVTSIVTNAFEYSGLKTIHGISGSYAETYAAENGYTFVAI